MPPAAKQRSSSTTNTDVVPEKIAPTGNVEVDLGDHVMVYQGEHFGPGKVKVAKEIASDLKASKEKADRRRAGISESVRQQMHPLDEEEDDEDEEEEAEPPPPPPPGGAAASTAGATGEVATGEDPSAMLES